MNKQYFFKYPKLKEKVKDIDYFNEIIGKDFKSQVKCTHICKQVY